MSGDLPIEVRQACDAIIERMRAVYGHMQPNIPLSDFSPLDGEAVNQWAARLEGARPEIIQVELERLRMSLSLPVVDDTNIQFEHLKIHYEISAIISLVESASKLAESVLGGEMAGLSISRDAVIREIAVLNGDLKAVSNKIDGVRAQVDILEKSGITLSIGVISIEIDTIASIIEKIIEEITYSISINLNFVWAAILELYRSIAKVAQALAAPGQSIASSVDDAREILELGDSVVESGRALVGRGAQNLSSEVPGESSKSRGRWPGFRILAPDIVVDLGTTRTRIFVAGRGLVVDEPSVVALISVGGRLVVHAVGEPARRLAVRPPSDVQIVYPVRGGVIVRYELAALMLQHFLKPVRERAWLVKPRIVMTMPTDATEVEERALRDCALSTSARKVAVLDQTLCAAVGAGLNANGMPSVVMNLGGGQSESAVTHGLRVENYRCARGGGVSASQSIKNYMIRNFNLEISEHVAEDIKVQLGGAYISRSKKGSEGFEHIRGRDIMQRVPREVRVKESDISNAISDYVSNSVETIKRVIEESHNILDIHNNGGIVLTGGGALLKGFDAEVRDHTGFPVVVATNSSMCTILGAASVVTNADMAARSIVWTV